MAHVLFDYLSQHGGVDYMNLSTGEITSYPKKDFFKVEAAAETSNEVDDAKEEEPYVLRYDAKQLQGVIDLFKTYSKFHDFCFEECNEEYKYTRGSVRLNGVSYRFGLTNQDEFSKLVNNKTVEQLDKCLNACFIKGASTLESKAMIVLHLCAGF